MARYYKTKSGRIILRSSDGKFRKSTLKDIGLIENDKGYYVCNNCGEGKCKDNSWKPILAPDECWVCGSKDIEPLKIKLTERAIELNNIIEKNTKDFIDPTWFRKEYPELKREYDIEYQKSINNSFEC